MNSDTKQQCHDQAMLHYLNGHQLAKDSLLLVQPSNHLLNGFLHNCLGKKNKTIHLTDHKLSVVAKELGLGEVDISSTESGGQHSAAGEDNIGS